MKKIYTLLFLCCLLFTKHISAQTFSSNCATPVAISSGTLYVLPTLIGTPNTDLSNDYGCITPANNANWFFFQACEPGTVTIIFSSSLSSASDINCIAWGPLAASTDCGLLPSQILDCSSTSGTADTLSFPVVTGMYYKILVSNPSNQSGTYNFGASSSPSFMASCPACSGPPPVQQICQVTTDPVLNKNIIIWEKDTTYTGNYIIQKESTTMGVYTTLATVINSDTSAYTDSVSNPMIQSFRYRIVTNDTCGNLINGSSHTTIHLLTSLSSSTGYPQLLWNAYGGFGYGTFYIYRGSSPATLALYDSVSASVTSYTDVAAVTGMNYYSVAVFPAMPCQPSRAMLMPSMSNTSPVMFTGINEFEFNQLTVGPNPANNTLNFSLGIVSADFSLELIDVTGRIILSEKFQNVNSETIDLSSISNGSYVVRFSSESKTTHRNIIIAK